MKPPLAERSALPGPAGTLEALIETPVAIGSGSAPGCFGVVCHPHPLYGGTLDNKVVYTLARAFEELALPTIRFNFRGVGTSEGVYDDGRGESEDALAVIDYGRKRWPAASLWMAGFSFGAAVALRAAARALPERLVVVAPGVTRLGMDGVPSPRCPWLLVQGDADDVVAPEEVLEWARRQSPQPTVKILPGAGHFFHGRLPELRQIVLEFLRGT